MKTARVIISVALISFLIFAGLGKLFVYGYGRYFVHEQQFIKEASRGTTPYDIIFVGSSRTHVHVNPRIIDSITGLNSYNFGIEGGRIFEMEMLIRSYLSRHKPPRLLVLDVMSTSLQVPEVPFFNPNHYYAFLDDTAFYSTLSSYKPAGLLKYLGAWRITEADDHLKAGAIAGLLGKTKTAEGSGYKGFVPNRPDTIAPQPRPITDTITRFELEAAGKEKLAQIARACHAKGVQLVLTYSPDYNGYQYPNRKAFFAYMDSFSRAQGLPYFNYSTHPISGNNRMFSDPAHLNNIGADTFSRLLAADLLSLLKASPARPAQTATP